MLKMVPFTWCKDLLCFLSWLTLTFEIFCRCLDLQFTAFEISKPFTYNWIQCVCQQFLPRRTQVHFQLLDITSSMWLCKTNLVCILRGSKFLRAEWQKISHFGKFLFCFFNTCFINWWMGLGDETILIGVGDRFIPAMMVGCVYSIWIDLNKRKNSQSVCSFWLSRLSTHHFPLQNVVWAPVEESGCALEKRKNNA